MNLAPYGWSVFWITYNVVFYVYPWVIRRKRARLLAEAEDGLF